VAPADYPSVLLLLLLPLQILQTLLLLLLRWQAV
jgi:hypothetical protein